MGWPKPLALALESHGAGEPLGGLETQADQLFQRETDRIVRRHTGKRPLDVGADRIARTAQSALRLLEQLRIATGEDLPLAWEPGQLSQTSAIEVYPAAVLKGRGWVSSGYKAKHAEGPRQSILNHLSQELEIPKHLHGTLVKSDHPLDAVLCILAAVDFLAGKVLSPIDESLAKREGWIWFSTENT